MRNVSRACIVLGVLALAVGLRPRRRQRATHTSGAPTHAAATHHCVQNGANLGLEMGPWC